VHGQLIQLGTDGILIELLNHSVSSDSHASFNRLVVPPGARLLARLVIARSPVARGQQCLRLLSILLAGLAAALTGGQGTS